MNFINYILEGFTDILQFIFGNILNILSAPIMSILNKFIPNFSGLLNGVTDFCNNYIFKGFQFVKMAFLNITGLSHVLFNFASVTVLISLYLFITLNLFKLIYNVWRIYNGSQKSN